jgi:release factor glutamine methyltransferase
VSAQRPPSVTVAEALADAATALAEAGIHDAATDARLLLQRALGLDRVALFLARGDPLSAEAAVRLGVLVDRRLRREPVSRILGSREFWSLPFGLGPATLDPRPDSETLVAAALAHLMPADRAWRILDLGTGTGCLLLATLWERSAAFGIGIDRSTEAAAIARANAAALGLAGRAAFAAGDWATAIRGAFDLVLCNPPYIAEGEISSLEPEVALHDPHAALSGGVDGLDAYRRVAEEISGLMTKDGVAIFELGAGQGNAVAGILADAGLATLERREDLGGIPRCLIAGKAIAPRKALAHC